MVFARISPIVPGIIVFGHSVISGFNCLAFEGLTKELGLNRFCTLFGGASHGFYLRPIRPMRLPGGTLMIDNPGLCELHLWNGEAGLEVA